MFSMPLLYNQIYSIFYTTLTIPFLIYAVIIFFRSVLFTTLLSLALSFKLSHLFFAVLHYNPIHFVFLTLLYMMILISTHLFFLHDQDHRSYEPSVVFFSHFAITNINLSLHHLDSNIKNSNIYKFNLMTIP